MTQPIEKLLTRLPNTKKSGQGWQTLCPAHEDHKPSLSINQGTDGRALVHCHAGCSVEAICEALGLTLRDLMADTNPLSVLTQPRVASSNRGSVNVSNSYPTAEEAIVELEKQFETRDAVWTYTDADGRPVGVVVRWDRDTDKVIRPVALFETGWKLKGMLSPRPLYNLTELGDAKRVFIVEGEKAAEAARTHGLIATTSAHGANSAAKTDWTPLAGKECIVLPDNDEAGQKYAEQVCAILHSLRPAPLIKIVHLPGLPAGGDIVDFCESMEAKP